MAREKKEEESSGAGMGWLVTFADLMTLLLTFFVLLLSMASMDRSIMREIAVSLVGDEGLAPIKGAGKVPVQFEFIKQTLDDQGKIFENHQRLKDTLFPDEVLPKDMTRSALLNNLEVLARPEGVAVALSEGLLFQSGQSSLSEDSKKLLSEFVAFLASSPVPVNIAGYTDDVPGGIKDNLALSAERAMAVLAFFLDQGFEPERFSVSAYGPAFPLAENTTPEGRAKNRRVEILLKTMGRTYL